MNTRKPFVVPALTGILLFRLKAPKGGTTNGAKRLMQFPMSRRAYVGNSSLTGVSGSSAVSATALTLGNVGPNTFITLSAVAR